MKRCGIYILAGTSVSAILAFLFGDRSTAHGSADSIVPVISVSDEAITSPQSAKEAIRRQSQKLNMTVEEVENRIADKILESRSFLKTMSGGYAPGTHFVDYPNIKGHDPRVVRMSPVKVLDIDRDPELVKGIKYPDQYSSENGMYIDPMFVGDTKLAKAKFEGHTLDGKYLKGEDYATTERLRALERTPSGKSGWTGLTRLCSGYEGIGRILIRENDNLAAETITLVPKTTLNARIATYDAELSRLQDRHGNTESSVTWYGPNGRISSLHIRQVDDRSVDAMMRLAESLAGRNTR